MYCYPEFKLRYLKNLKLFPIRVKELFEPIVLQRKGDRFLLVLILIYPAHFEDVPCQSGVITFLKVRKIMYLDKAYIIVKRNV